MFVECFVMPRMRPSKSRGCVFRLVLVEFVCGWMAPDPTSHLDFVGTDSWCEIRNFGHIVSCVVRVGPDRDTCVARQYQKTKGKRADCMDIKKRQDVIDRNKATVTRLLRDILLQMRLVNTTYRLSFILAGNLAVKVIVGTRYMNRYVEAIKRRDQNGKNRPREDDSDIVPSRCPQPTWAAVIVTLARDRLNAMPNDNDATNGNIGNDKRTNNAPFNQAHMIRKARTIRIPLISNLAVSLVIKEHPNSYTLNGGTRSRRDITYGPRTEYATYDPKLSSNWA